MASKRKKKQNKKQVKKKEKGQVENLKERLDYGKEVHRLKT